MEVKIKLEEGAVLPKYSKPGDVGMDLTAITVRYDSDMDYIEYDSGVSVEIPEGYVGLVFPRSSISNKDLHLTNAVGIIDSEFRGTIKSRFKITSCYEQEVSINPFLNMGEFQVYVHALDVVRDTVINIPVYAVGERFAQLIIMPYPKIEFKVVDKLSETERGEGGYGSTNIK